MPIKAASLPIKAGTLLRNAPAWLPGVLKVYTVSALVKICIMMDAYRSTDFTVHWSWKANTATRPLREWYSGTFPVAQLDYPLFSGFFEAVLGSLVLWIDPSVSPPRSLTEAPSAFLVLFQRMSVILVSDTVLVLGAVALYIALKKDSEIRGRKSTKPRNSSDCSILAGCVLFYPALFLVDHVHFQYNGLHIGVYLLIMAFLERGWIEAASATYTFLLGMKHIYLYGGLSIALVVFSRLDYNIKAILLKAALPSLAVLSMGILTPFALFNGSLKSMLTLMFPFGLREMCHSHVTGNICALGVAANCIAMKVQGLGSCAPSISHGHEGVELRGLPKMRPIVLVMLVLFVHALMFKYLIFRRTSLQRVAPTVIVVFGTFASFALGWHVHEKAALMFAVPLLVYSFARMNEAGSTNLRAGAWIASFAVSLNCIMLIPGGRSHSAVVVMIVGGLILQLLSLRACVRDTRYFIILGVIAWVVNLWYNASKVWHAVLLAGLALICYGTCILRVLKAVH